MQVQQTFKLEDEDMEDSDMDDMIQGEEHKSAISAVDTEILNERGVSYSIDKSKSFNAGVLTSVEVRMK